MLRDIYQKPLHELDLTGLAELCANVARNRSANPKQSDTAHALRVEWVTLHFDGLPHDDKSEAEVVLRRRMVEFLDEVPNWMLSGV